MTIQRFWAWHGALKVYTTGQDPYVCGMHDGMILMTSIPLLALWQRRI